MAGRSAVLAIRIIADSRQARGELDQTGQAAGRFSSTMKRAALPAAALVTGLGAIAKSAIDSASALQQSTGGVASIYGKYAGEITKVAKGAATSVGLSQAAYQDQAVLLGSQLKNLGQPIDQVAGSTNNLIKQAADMAATFGGPTSKAVEAIGSLLRGESNPIEAYGVSINQAAIKAYVLEHNLKNTTAAQQVAAKRTAIMALLYKQTAAATGQFAREQNTAAGSTEIANAKFENAKAALGARLLPVYAKFKSILGSVASFIANNSTLVFTLAGVLGGLAIAILAVNAAMRIWTAVTAAFTAIQNLSNVALLNNPIVRIVAIVLALAAALVVAYQRSETFRNIVNAVFSAVKAAIMPVVNLFTVILPGAFSFLYRSLVSIWNTVVTFIKTWGPRALIFLAPFIGIPLLIYRNFGKIVGFLSSVWTSVYRTVSGFVGNVISAVTGIPGRLAGAAKNFLNVGGSLIGAFFRGIGNAIKGAAGFAVDIAKTIVNALVAGINNILDLPWKIELHIDIPYAPDIDFGPYTLLPSIPMWSSAGAPARPAISGFGDLVPGFSLFAAMAGWSANIDSRAGSSSTPPAPVVININGLIVDPIGTARQIEQVLTRYGLTTSIRPRAAL